MKYCSHIEEIRSRLPEREIRFVNVQPRVGSVRIPDGPGVLRGYGALFGEWSDDLGGFRERIAKGAFTKSLRENPDILIAFNHNPSQLIGRTSAGTATVVEDSVGLLVSVTPVDTALASDVTELVKTQHVRGMSFAFSTVDDHWWEKDGEVFRELRELKLYEVGPVTSPAYPATMIYANGGRQKAASPHPHRDRLRKRLDGLKLDRAIDDLLAVQAIARRSGDSITANHLEGIYQRKLERLLKLKTELGVPING